MGLTKYQKIIQLKGIYYHYVKILEDMGILPSNWRLNPAYIDFIDEVVNFCTSDKIQHSLPREQKIKIFLEHYDKKTSANNAKPPVNSKIQFGSTNPRTNTFTSIEEQKGGTYNHPHKFVENTTQPSQPKPDKLISLLGVLAKNFIFDYDVYGLLSIAIYIYDGSPNKTLTIHPGQKDTAEKLSKLFPKALEFQENKLIINYPALFEYTKNA